MSFDTQIESDLDVFLNVDEFGETITYDGGEGISATVTTDDTTHELAPDAHQGRVYVKVSDFSSVPVYNKDVVREDGSTWKTYRDAEDNVYYESKGMYIINITKDERPGLL